MIPEADTLPRRLRSVVARPSEVMTSRFIESKGGAAPPITSTLILAAIVSACNVCDVKPAALCKRIEPGGGVTIEELDRRRRVIAARWVSMRLIEIGLGEGSLARQRYAQRVFSRHQPLSVKPCERATFAADQEELDRLVRVAEAEATAIVRDALARGGVAA